MMPSMTMHMALAAERAIGERHQGKRAAFAVIVGAEQDQHVFDGDDEEQRPDDERQNAQDHRLGRLWPPLVAASTDSRKA